MHTFSILATMGIAATLVTAAAVPRSVQYPAADAAPAATAGRDDVWFVSRCKKDDTGEWLHHMDWYTSTEASYNGAKPSYSTEWKSDPWGAQNPEGVVTRYPFNDGKLWVETHLNDWGDGNVVDSVGVQFTCERSTGEFLFENWGQHCYAYFRCWVPN